MNLFLRKFSRVPSRNFVCLTAIITALVLSSCGTLPPVTPPLPDAPLPRIIAPQAKPGYTRSLQTEPDTFVLQTGRRAFRSATDRGPDIELLGAAHIGEARYYGEPQVR